MYDYLDLRQTERLKELVPYKALAPDADEIIEELDRLNNLNKQLVEECQRLDDEETRLNNILDELEKYINKEYVYDDIGMKIFDASKLQDKLKELKEEK